MTKSASELVSKFLAKDGIRIRDPKQLEAKLNAMAQLGVDKFMVISDFGHTLSRFHKNGQKRLQSYAILLEIAEANGDADFVRKIDELRDKYKPFEYCTKMTMEEKGQLMEEWWEQTYELIVGRRWTRKMLKNAIERTNRIELRDGCVDFFCSLEQASVPLVVISAGSGELAEMLPHKTARQLGLLAAGKTLQMQNVHIISNFMLFSGDADDADDDDDNAAVCIGFSQPLIHSYNKKNAFKLLKKQQQQGNGRQSMRECDDRTSILLLGDSHGDHQMDTGVVEEAAKSTVLKIGYLNMNFDAMLEPFMQNYDIVLVDDQTMDVPSQILAHINNVF